MGDAGNSQLIIGITGDVLAIIFFLMPVLQIYQMCKGVLKPADVSYLVFIVNGTMSIFFSCDFFRVGDVIALLPNSISKLL